jgi:virulence-associated protein VapD
MTSNEVRELKRKIEDIKNSIDELFDDIQGSVDVYLDHNDLEEINNINRYTERALTELEDVDSELDTIPDSEEKLIEEDEDEDEEEENEDEEKEENNGNQTK